MAQLIIEPEAEAELEEAGDRYGESVPGLGLEFLLHPAEPPQSERLKSALEGPRFANEAYIINPPPMTDPTQPAVRSSERLSKEPVMRELPLGVATVPTLLGKATPAWLSASSSVPAGIFTWQGAVQSRS